MSGDVVADANAIMSIAARLLIGSVLISLHSPSATRLCAMERTEPNATLTEIRKSYGAWRRRITSLRCEGVLVGRTAITPTGVKRISRHIFCVDSARRYAEFRHLRDGLRWEDDFDWNTVFMADGRCTVYRPVDCYASTSKSASTPNHNAKLWDTYYNFYGSTGF